MHAQTKGILAGYNEAVRVSGMQGNTKDAATPQTLELADLMRLQIDGAISDYLKAFYERGSGRYAAAFSAFIQKQKERELGVGNKAPRERPGRCSALVKLIREDVENDPSSPIRDLYLGHATWEDYSECNRIWKMYYYYFTIIIF